MVVQTTKAEETSPKQDSKRLTYRKSTRESVRAGGVAASTDRSSETVPRTPQDSQLKHPQTPSSGNRPVRTPSSAQKQFASSQNSVPASETDSPNSMVAGTPTSKGNKHPTARMSNDGSFAKQRSALSRKRTASMVANTLPAEEIPSKKSRKGEPAFQASSRTTKSSTVSQKTASKASKGQNSTAVRALSWSAQKKRAHLFKPVKPVSFYGASDEKDLDDKLAFMVESNGVLVRTELHKAKCDQEAKVKKEVKRIEDGKKRLGALKRNKVGNIPAFILTRKYLLANINLYFNSTSFRN